MSHLDHYRYQTAARGVSSAEDVARIAADNTPVYDHLVLPWLPPNRNARIVDLACGSDHVKYPHSCIWMCLRA